VSEIKLTLDDPKLFARRLRVAANDYGVSNGEGLGSALREAADQIDAQAKAPVEEPTEPPEPTQYGSIILARASEHEQHERWCSPTSEPGWYSEFGGFVGGYQMLRDVEVLRVGIGEPAAALRSTLAVLVELHDGPRDDHYRSRKPLAWQAARDALGEPAPSPAEAVEADKALRDAAARLVDIVDSSPETASYIADRYPGLDHAIDLVRRHLPQTDDGAGPPPAATSAGLALTAQAGEANASPAPSSPSGPSPVQVDAEPPKGGLFSSVLAVDPGVALREELGEIPTGTTDAQIRAAVTLPAPAEDDPIEALPDASTPVGNEIEALVSEYQAVICRTDGVMRREGLLREAFARVLDVGGQQPGVSVGGVESLIWSLKELQRVAITATEKHCYGLAAAKASALLPKEARAATLRAGDPS